MTPPSRRLRVAIANDSMLAVTVLTRLVQAGGHDVIWVAHDGAAALVHALADRPDILLMDLVMPTVDGAASTGAIMRQAPCAILVVTSSLRANQDLVYDAMSAGAMGAIETPTSRDTDHPSVRDFFAKFARIGRLTHAAPRQGGGPPAAGKGPTSDVGQANVRVAPPARQAVGSGASLVVLGSSTGGPAALRRVLATFPTDLAAAVVIVQHVSEPFAEGLAAWLTHHTGFPVVPARSGDRPTAGRALLAATDDHLVLEEAGTLRYTPHPLDNPYRPSVDAFMASVSAHWPGTGVAALLTGMGRDGAQGLAALLQRGFWTVAQDEATSVVYGMPRAAKELGAARAVLPIDEIGGSLLRHLGVFAKSPTP